jgi:hypothetical protein
MNMTIFLVLLSCIITVPSVIAITNYTSYDLPSNVAQGFWFVGNATNNVELKGSSFMNNDPTHFGITGIWEGNITFYSPTTSIPLLTMTEMEWSTRSFLSLFKSSTSSNPDISRFQMSYTVQLGPEVYPSSGFRSQATYDRDFTYYIAENPNGELDISFNNATYTSDSYRFLLSRFNSTTKVYYDTCDPYDPDTDSTELYYLDSAYMGAGSFLVGLEYESANNTAFISEASGFALGILQPSSSGDQICQFSVFDIVLSNDISYQQIWANVTYNPSFGVGCSLFYIDESKTPYLDIISWDFKTKTRNINISLPLIQESVKLGEVQFSPSGDLLVAFTAGNSFDLDSLVINSWTPNITAQQNALILAAYNPIGEVIWSQIGICYNPTLGGIDLDARVATDEQNKFIYFAVPYVSSITFETMSFQGILVTEEDPKPTNLLLMKLDTLGNMIWYTQSVSRDAEYDLFLNLVSLDVAIINSQTSILLGLNFAGGQSLGNINYTGVDYPQSIAAFQLIEQNPATNYSIPVCPSQTPT